MTEISVSKLGLASEIFFVAAEQKDITEKITVVPSERSVNIVTAPVVPLKVSSAVFTPTTAPIPAKEINLAAPLQATHFSQSTFTQ